jgi:hypothetical protein
MSIGHAFLQLNDRHAAFGQGMPRRDILVKQNGG